MNELDFYEELEGSLGGNLVDVELVEDDYIRAFNQAKRVYKQKGNNNFRRNFITLNLVAGTVLYPLPQNVNDIVQIIKPSSFYSDDPFSLAYISDMFSGMKTSVGSGLATYELSTQMIENIDIYTAAATPFNFDRINKTITFLDRIDTSDSWVLEVYEDLNDSEYRDMLWIYEWTLAELKITLGRAYSKFSSLSSPTGETSLNGDSLISEGNEDKIKLLEDIKNHVDASPTSLPIMIG